MDKEPICYLCGKSLSSEETDTDHVPFKGLFLTPNPRGVIKISTHKRCNYSFHFDEEYALLLLVSLAAHWSPVATKIWKKKVLPALKRSDKKKFYERLLEEIQNAEKFYSNLPQILKGYKAIGIDINRLSRVLWKIARGLYFYKNEQRVEENFSGMEIVEARQFGKPADIDFFVIGDEKEFQYNVTQSPDTLEYQFVFYDVHLFKLKAAPHKIL